MISITEIEPNNLYSQDDGEFLLGQGFSVKSARDIICEACRSGQLPATLWKKRYWFAGKDFLEWIQRWFGRQVHFNSDLAKANEEKAVVKSVPLRQNERCRFGTRSPLVRKEVSDE